MITNSSGARVQTLAYYPYGDIRVNQSSATPTVDAHYKYTGKELDASSNLYFYESRYYHAIFGRFVSPDSIVPNLKIPQDLNRYAYARNNPMLYTDPSGHCPICIGIGIGILVGVISSGIQSDWDLEATLIGGAIGGASAGVGAGVASSVYSATLSALGGTWAGVAGGAVGGAAAGGTSAVLANAAGYRVNVGLAIASAAAAGGIMGGAGAWGAQKGYGELVAFAASPVAGASAAAINGSDPGFGALIAASTTAFSLSLQSSLRNLTLQGRVLTTEELAVAKSVFGDRIDYGNLRIFRSKYFWTQGADHAVTPNGNVYWPSDSCGNMILCGQGKLFIHEMTHVMQYQQGISVFGQGLLLQGARFGSLLFYDPYNFIYDPNRAFSSYNIEQQGKMVEEMYEGRLPNSIQ